MTARTQTDELAAGRSVVVTGGSSGIGRAIVRRFADAGDKVIAVGRDVTRLRESVAGTDALFRVCDVTDESAVRALFSELAMIDILVTSAGTATAAPVAQVTLEQWEIEYATNATSVFLCAREAARLMLKRQTGRIVVVASIAGLQGQRYASSYTASKHGAVGFVRAIAAELAHTGITVNAVCPAFVDTPMTERAVRQIMEATGRDEEGAAHSLAQLSPLGRLLDPEEVAAAVSYLASSEASSVTGHCLVLGGSPA